MRKHVIQFEIEVADNDTTTDIKEEVKALMDLLPYTAKKLVLDPPPVIEKGYDRYEPYEPYKPYKPSEPYYPYGPDKAPWKYDKHDQDQIWMKNYNALREKAEDLKNKLRATLPPDSESHWPLTKI